MLWLLAACRDMTWSLVLLPLDQGVDTVVSLDRHSLLATHFAISSRSAQTFLQNSNFGSSAQISKQRCQDVTLAFCDCALVFFKCMFSFTRFTFLSFALFIFVYRSFYFVFLLVRFFSYYSLYYFFYIICSKQLDFLTPSINPVSGFNKKNYLSKKNYVSKKNFNFYEIFDFFPSYFLSKKYFKSNSFCFHRLLQIVLSQRKQFVQLIFNLRSKT